VISISKSNIFTKHFPLRIILIFYIIIPIIVTTFKIYCKNLFSLIFIVLFSFLVFYFISIYSSLLVYVAKKKAFIITIMTNFLMILGLVPLYIDLIKNLKEDITSFNPILLSIALLFLAPTIIIFNKYRINDMLKIKNIIGNNPINIKNEGYITKQGNYIYYYIMGRKFLSENGLYVSKINKDGIIIPQFGFNKIKLVSGDISNINVVDKFIYFLKYNKIINCNVIYKYEIGKNKKNVIMKNCDFIYILNGIMYYLKYEDNPSINKQGVICSLNLENNNFNQISDKKCYNFTINEFKIYYTNKNGLFSQDLNHKNHSKILDFIPDYYYIQENNIYFSIYNLDKGNTVIYKFLIFDELCKQDMYKFEFITIKENILEFFIKDNIIIYLTPLVAAYIDLKDPKNHNVLKNINHLYFFDGAIFYGWNRTEFLNIHIMK